VPRVLVQEAINPRPTAGIALELIWIFFPSGCTGNRNEEDAVIVWKVGI